MKWMLGTYTQHVNARHRLRGHLFAGRYKALLVDGSDDFYLRAVCNYVQLNPRRALLLDEAAPLEKYLWSSYPSYLLPAKKRPQWMRVDRLLGEHGITNEGAQGRREFSRRMEERRVEPDEQEGIVAHIRRGWRLGAEDFMDHLEDRMGRATRERHEPAQVRESMLLQGRRIIREELTGFGMSAAEFLALPKGSLVKTILAKKIRQSTTLTLKEVTELLNAGTWRTLANALSKICHYE